MIYRNITSLVVGSLLLSLPSISHSAGSNPLSKDRYPWSHGTYIGGGINGNAESFMHLNNTPEVFMHYLPLSSSATEVEQTNNSVGFDIYVGHDLNPYWSVELGYTYVANINLDGEMNEIEFQEIRISQWNAHFVAVGKLPIASNFNAFAKLGVAYFGSNQDFGTEDLETEINDSIRTAAITYGAGIEVAWMNWGVRGEYNIISPSTSFSDDFYIADIISANLYYKFE